MSKFSLDIPIDSSTRHQTRPHCEDKRTSKDKHGFKKAYNEAKRKTADHDEKSPLDSLFSLASNHAALKQNTASALPPCTGHVSSTFVPDGAALQTSPVADIEFEQLFEKMCGTMTHMAASGVSETTLSLTSPQYASSLFYGAQIVITEYSTAPKAFNICFIAQSEAIAVFHRNIKELMTVFSSSERDYQIHRIDTSHSSNDQQLFHRKAPIEQELL